MPKSSSHNTSSPEITPKEEPITPDKPKSPNLFLPATQVEFTFEEISFTTNNEVALLYRSHPNQEYFKDVSDFISKFCLKEAFIRAPTQYRECLSEFWYMTKTLKDYKVWVSTPTGRVRGDVCITTFRNALRAQYLPHSSMYISLPSMTIVRLWFTTTRYSREIREKETLKKSCLPPKWRFAIMVENTSEAMTKHVPSAGQATASPAKGEKNTKDAETNMKDELVDLLL
uniref:Uncharacterized protein n=1 Tax=Tanacetum cinerariifolium TaxID=118510 RepID=A0A699JC41_TANCI|nr:hypothetical protein [Tanacetum cinerariifolium]